MEFISLHEIKQPLFSTIKASLCKKRDSSSLVSLFLSLIRTLTLALMSTLNHLFGLPEQICYVQCGFCATILMVSVPCSSLSMVVTVRCGHCTSLLSVNMMKASFVPLHLLASFTHLQPKEGSPEEEADKTLDSHNHNGGFMMTYSDCEEEDAIPMSIVAHKPPEKRQRTPSAYNRFIKEEIRRLKAENPDMAHKEAFSTAAKNWASKGDEESCSQTEQLVDLDSHLDPHEEAEAKQEEEEEGQGFRERKVPRNSIWARTPFE